MLRDNRQILASGWYVLDSNGRDEVVGGHCLPMRIDIAASKRKEVYIQVELYRILMNTCVVAASRPSVVGRSESSVKPRDILIEPTISSQTIRDRPGKKRADLVLIGQRQSAYRTEDFPLLVIEVKKRKHERITRPYQAYLNQADGYARSINCRFYSVYDGNTFILMQFPEPYLIGFHSWSIKCDEKEKQQFALKLWNTMCRIADSYPSEPVEGFQQHSDIFLWERTIPYLVKDAFVRNCKASGWTPDKQLAIETGVRFSKTWLEMHGF